MRPPRSNQPSLLLTDEENAMVFDFLGSRCQVFKINYFWMKFKQKFKEKKKWAKNRQNGKNHIFFLKFRKIDNVHGSGSVIHYKASSPFSVEQTHHCNCLLRSRQHTKIILCPSLLLGTTRALLGRTTAHMDRGRETVRFSSQFCWRGKHMNEMEEEYCWILSMRQRKNFEFIVQFDKRKKKWLFHSLIFFLKWNYFSLWIELYDWLEFRFKRGGQGISRNYGWDHYESTTAIAEACISQWKCAPERSSRFNIFVHFFWKIYIFFLF